MAAAGLLNKILKLSCNVIKLFLKTNATLLYGFYFLHKLLYYLVTPRLRVHVKNHIIGYIACNLVYGT